jgi:hypothetical protein
VTVVNDETIFSSPSSNVRARRLVFFGFRYGLVMVVSLRARGLEIDFRGFGARPMTVK